jgi:bacterioferritin-associated ferredoxin
MIVCLCHVVTDRAVRASIDGGARTVVEVERACGAGAGCGMCRPALAQMIEERACENACPDCPRRAEAVRSPYLEASGEAA